MWILQSPFSTEALIYRLLRSTRKHDAEANLSPSSRTLWSFSVASGIRLSSGRGFRPCTRNESSAKRRPLTGIMTVQVWPCYILRPLLCSRWCSANDLGLYFTSLSHELIIISSSISSSSCRSSTFLIVFYIHTYYLYIHRHMSINRQI